MLNYILAGSDMKVYILHMLICLPIILLSLSMHETAHGYAAMKCGDNTARNLGRLTLNPLKHIDPIGFISMLLFGFGWAKPVPINSRNFKKPKRDVAITAAAGPVSNLILAVIFALILRIYYAAVGNVVFSSGTAFYIAELFLFFFYYGIRMNVTLAIFNLIPVPPFDGSRIFFSFLPTNLYFKIMKYEKYIYIGFMLLLLTGILTPFINFVSNFVVRLIFKIVFMPNIFGI